MIGEAMRVFRNKDSNIRRLTIGCGNLSVDVIRACGFTLVSQQ